MERLSKDAPLEKLTAEQKKEIAELNSQQQSKIAEVEIAFSGKMDAARNQEDFNGVEILQQELTTERRRIEERFEDKKTAIRGGA
jgi:uncharacterized protein YPO0396